jgi:NarL family two-component system response regulator LiaR
MVMAQPIRVVLADDSARARDGLRALLATWSQVEVVGEAVNGQEAVRLAAECQPDVVLMDLHMPVLDGAQATQLVKQQWPSITVIVLTMYVAEQTAALGAGADAFLIKGGAPERLLAALGMGVAGGEP